MSTAALIIGIGNDYRRDDAAGLIAARRLQAQYLSGVTVIETQGGGLALIEMWQEADLVILIDAVRSGASAGTIHRFDARSQPLPAIFFNHSTHALGLAEAVELSRTLDRLPSRLFIYGIEGRDFAAGTEISAEVDNAIYSVVDEIKTKLVKFPTS